MPNLIKNNIVIYHTGALGDLLVSTAALYESLKLFPQGSEFTMAGSSLWKEILLPSQWPQIKFILHVEKKQWRCVRLWQADLNQDLWIEKKFEFKSFREFLRQFDVSIDFRTESLRFAIQSFWARIPKRIGSSRHFWARFLFTDFSLETKTQECHERDRYLRVLPGVNLGNWKDKGLPRLKKFEEIDFRQATGDTPKRVILINPTASIREKAWASPNFRQLALRLKQLGYPVMIIGAPHETEWLREVAGQDFRILQPQRILDLINLVAGALLLITNTSSMQFVAAGTETFVLTLMGSAKPKIWGPLGKLSMLVKECPDFVISEKTAYDFISVDLVFQKSIEILNDQNQIKPRP